MSLMPVLARSLWNPNSAPEEDPYEGEGAAVEAEDAVSYSIDLSPRVQEFPRPLAGGQVHPQQ